ncbi:uncharacterized protein [Diadema antillarum]|uniref:uncharacterized protein n=1 Tax=Diadema antillarum TaxID=105358 RepID=UPI003A850812
MQKNTLKLDAICAKLKKGLSGLPPQEAPCPTATLPCGSDSRSYSHEGREACKPDGGATNLQALHNGGITRDTSAQLPMLQATENYGYRDSELPEYKDAIRATGRDGEDSRCSSPKVLSGASKRKSRQCFTRVTTQPDSPEDWEGSSVNSYQDCDQSLDSGVVDSQPEDQINGLEHWEEDREDPDTTSYDTTQEHNHEDDNVSMQINPYSHATNHKANLGNKIGHDAPSSSSAAEMSAYKVAGHDLRVRSSYKVPMYDETGLSDEEEVRGEATYDPRAIMEYAERSWCNEHGTEIEEGLETSAVICEIDESGKTPQGQESKPRRRRGRPSLSEQVKAAVEEQGDETTKHEETAERDGEKVETRSHDEEMKKVDVQEDREMEEEEEEVVEEEEEEETAMETSSSSPLPTSSHSIKEGQTAPTTSYDVDGLEAVKEYATDTMKEFLGMYGYMEEGGGAREEELPLDHIRRILELERRHAEKRRASVLQRFQSQSGQGTSDGPDQSDSPGPSLSHSSAFVKHSSGNSSESKETSMMREAGDRQAAPSHTVLQQLAALHQQLRAEESALISQQDLGDGLPGNQESSHHPDLDHTQPRTSGRNHLEMMREAEGGVIPDLLAPHPGVLAAHLEGKVSPRMATGKTVKQLIEEQEFMRNLMELGDRAETKRFSKYDYFIQKLEAGESISKDVPNLRVSKYDSYIRKLKAGQSINKIIGRKVSASQRIRDIISQQIQLKQGGVGGHGNENGSKEDAEAEALEAAILENSGFGRTDYSAVAAAAAASASSAAAAALNLDPKSGGPSKYDYYVSKLRKGEGLSPYTVLEGLASTSSGSSNSAISPPLEDYPRDEHSRDEDRMEEYETYKSRNNILKKCLLETGRSDLDSEEGSEKGIKSGTLSTSSSPGLEGSAFNRYIARFGASQDCGRCSYQFKEHYHCLDEDCKYARFTRKEDVIRHYNWHKRRDNSLQHGFMRFSPSDDCRPYYPGCTLNMKNTHYHCMQPGCHKVYTSTSDVLTHENFHKKNFTLLNDGFQRFRATEDCGTPRCSFYGQKTTHFHCRRPGCEFVFKNKCDIEKHKTFHMKDDIYRKDGFRKFSKHESCKYEGCRYSNTMNHFHCIRNGCSFVFTAANQMHSHKRKHERRQRMMEYETGRHFMRSIRPKLKLPLPRVNPTYRSLHSHHPQLPLGDKPLMMPPCPAIIFKSDPGAASIAERAALAGQSAGLGVSQTSPLASQVMPLSAHSTPRLDIQAVQPSVITSAPSSAPRPISPDSSKRSGFESMGEESAEEEKEPSLPAATSVITNTSAVTSEYHQSEDEEDDRPMDLQMLAKHRAGVEENSEEDDKPTDLSMRESQSREGELPSGFAKIAEMDKDAEGEDLNDSLNLPIASLISPPGQMMREEPEDSPPTRVIVKEEPREDGRQEEAWQKYFKRFTANDHCHSSCELLYKGHYHCIVEGCGEFFRSKEGVNKHTRYHLMSEEACELGFQYYQHGQSCEDIFKGCPFSPLAHYHCMWSLKPGSYCGEVVHTGSSLMKPHYEKHRQNPDLEAIRHSEVEKPGYLGTPVSQPPPKVVLKDQTMKWFPQTPTNPSGDKGYCKLDGGKCTKPECPLIAQMHYHCTRPDCNFATESHDMLHDHKSNEKLIFDSFRQFSRKLDCRRPGCKYNLLHKHYHCMHQGCQFSFLQIQQMESHGRKHMRRIYGKFFNRPNNNSPTGPQQLVLPILPLNSSGSPQGILSSPPSALSSPPGGLSSPQATIPSYQQMASLASSSPHQLVTSSSSALAQAVPINPSSTLHSMFVSPIPSTMQSMLAIPPQPIMTAPNGLLMDGSSPKGLHQFMVPIAPLDAEEPSPSTSRHLENSESGVQVLPNFQLGRWKIRSSSVVTPPRKSPSTPHKRPLTLVVEDPGAPSGYKRYKRGPLDSSMQERFERFERNVHCGEGNCQFAMNTTHYHCLHIGCNYKFAGKTMMYKHAQHHDRVDSIIQDDFQRYKASVSCDRSDCEYTAKSTHFHCLRCPFICTDSGKVAIHRKQHAKTEAVSAAGFRQFSSSEKCLSEDCKYSQKYSHFHCMRPGCMQAVIGMTQMESHSRKHRL